MDPITLAALATPALQFLGGIALACVPLLVRYTAKHLNLKTQSAQEQEIEALATMGARFAYQTLVAKGATIWDVPIKNEALANAVRMVQTLSPGIEARLGLSPEILQQRIISALGGLLAVDPTVSVIAAPTPKPEPVAVPTNGKPDPSSDAGGAPAAKVVPAAPAGGSVPVSLMGEKQ